MKTDLKMHAAGIEMLINILVTNYTLLYSIIELLAKNKKQDMKTNPKMHAAGTEIVMNISVSNSYTAVTAYLDYCRRHCSQYGNC